MKYQLIIPLTVMLSGCLFDADNSHTCSTVFGYDTSQVDQYGLTLEPSDDMHVSFEQISTIYENTMSCMGMTAPGPTVAYKSFTEQYIGGAWAVYVWTGELVWINTDTNVAERSCETDSQALQHEFIHHILHVNGLDNDDGGANTDIFKACGLGVSINR